MEIPERRQAKRLRVNLPVAFRHLGDEKQFAETVAKDISLTGLRMNTQSFMQPQTNLLVKLRFPEVNKVIEAIGSVSWSHRVSFSDHYQSGLSFSEINPIFKKWLEEYIVFNEAMPK
jgi:c-di-GMP-binding flagellar brake protein YcgR